MIYTTKTSKERMEYLKQPNYFMEREDIQMEAEPNFLFALLQGFMLVGAVLTIVYGLTLL